MSSVIKVDKIQSDTGTVNVASKIEFPAGTVSAPSIFPTGDTNTGIFFPAADTIAFAEGGAEAMRITSDGSVVINNVGSDAQIYLGGDSGSNRMYLARSGADSLLWNVSNGAMRFGTNNTERMRISATGVVGIGTTSPQGNFELRGGGTDDAQLYITTSTKTASRIGYVGLSNRFGMDVYNGLEVRDVAASYATRLLIDSSGNLLVGTTNPNVHTSSTDSGFVAKALGEVVMARDSGAPFSVNRLSNDGELVRFYQAGTQEGNISVSGNTVSYNQFMGSHWATLTDWSRPNIKIGTILDSINELVIYKYALIEVEEEIPAKEAVLDENGNEIEPAVEAQVNIVQKKICYNGNAEVGATVSVEYEGETYEGIVELERDREFTKAVKVKINDTAASKAVYGVFVGWNNDKNADGGIWNDMYVGAVGNYVVRMAEGQEPQIGDLIEADGNGCGVVQEDDIIRSKTVGKVTSNIPQVTYDDGSFLVTCVLYSG